MLYVYFWDRQSFYSGYFFVLEAYSNIALSFEGRNVMMCIEYKFQDSLLPHPEIPYTCTVYQQSSSLDTYIQDTMVNLTRSHSPKPKSPSHSYVCFILILSYVHVQFIDLHHTTNTAHENAILRLTNVLILCMLSKIALPNV